MRTALRLSAVVLVVLSTSLAVGGQTAVRPTDATVESPVLFNDSVEVAAVEGTPLRDWQTSPDDRAGFYGVDKRHLYYYDAATNALRAVDRPNARTFVNEGLLIGRYLAPKGQGIGEYTVASREPVRYTDRGTLAVGTTFGPFVYDLETEQWASRADQPIGGYPTITMDPSGVAAAGPYYVMTVNSDLLLAPGDWVGNVAEPPERFTTGEYPHLTSEARLSAYSDRVTKTGFPLVFRGTVGVTNESPDQIARGNSPWAAWEDEDSLVRFAEPNSGPTTVYDGAGSGTVVISGTDLVAYNVTTAEEEWRRDHSVVPAARRGNTLYTDERTLDLRTGETTSLYGETGDSHYETEYNGTSVSGNYDSVHSVTPDGRYVTLTMAGQSWPGKYRMRGVRILDTETREVVAQRTLLGHYRDRWVGYGHDYLAATTTEHALLVSPKLLYSLPGTVANESASVIDLETNETVSTVEIDHGRRTEVQATEDDVFVIANVPVNDNEGFGRVNASLAVYDPTIQDTIGNTTFWLEANERFKSVRTRKGDVYVFTTKGGQTRVRAYEGVDESISISASADASAVTVSVAELSGEPVPNAVVSLDGVESRTGPGGNATFDLRPPDQAGPISSHLRVETGEQVTQTNVTITYEQVTTTESSGGGQATTGTSTPGFSWLSTLLGLLGGSALLWSGRDHIAE